MRLIATGRVYGAPAGYGRGRTLAIVIACCLALGSAASLAGGLVSADPSTAPDEQSRKPSATEIGRLATMRLRNFSDGRAGVRGTLGHPGAEIHLAGWIDWQRRLAYLSVTAPTPAPADGLVQAVPGLIAVRPGRVPAASPAAPGAATEHADQPPATPPRDGWRVRAAAPAGSTASALDTVLLLLFAIGANQGDAADLVNHDGIRWLRSDTVGGVPVDVLRGPAAPAADAEPQPIEAGDSLRLSSLAAYGGAIRYWLDADARLRRLEAVVTPGLQLRLDFDRADRPELTAVDLLGGRATKPRPVTEGEAQTLARLRQRNRAAGGGTITVELPGETGDLVTAAGWLDWRRQVTYLAVQDTASPSGQTLVRADPDGLAVLANAPRTPDGRPPLTPSPGSWQRTRWGQDPTGQLHVLLGEALALSGVARDDADDLRRAAVWLRTDVLHGVPVTVYEVSRPAAGNPAGGEVGLRYWIDAAGVLRRLEVRSRIGSFGHLDIRPDRVPRLPAVQTSG